MKPSDGAFLAEVDDFLNSWSLSARLSDQSPSGADERGQSPPTTPDSSYDDTSEQLDVTAVESRPTKARTRRNARAIGDPVQLELMKERERKRRNNYRDRQRIERKSLDKQLRELTTKLAVWQEVRDSSNEVPNKAWQRLAQSELKARLASEARQQRLCAAIKVQAALAHEIQGFMRDRIKNFALDEVLEDIPHRQPSDAEIFKGLVEDIRAAYTQTDEVLSTCGINSEGRVLKGNVKTWNHEGDTGRCLYVDKQVVSASFQQTCESMWQLASLPHCQEDRQVFDLIENTENTENTIAIKFRFTTHRQQARVISVLQRSVGCQYQENGRMVIVWRSSMEGEGSYIGMRADETGWVVVNPLGDSPNAGTLLRTCVRHTTMPASGVVTQESAIEQFTSAVLDAVREAGVEVENKLKNLRL